MALVTAHVKRQMYVFSSPEWVLTKSGPAKSTPVTVNGFVSLTLIVGKGAGSGTLKDVPITLRQVTQRLSNFFTNCLIAIIQ